MNDHIHTLHVRGKMMRWATYGSMSVAVIIVMMKVSTWFITDSLSLLSSLIDSVLDIGASLVSFFAVRYALQPADEDHRFGHGKAEAIAAFAQSAFIAGSGVFVAGESIHRLISPQVVDHPVAGIIVMVISSVLTMCLLGFQTYVIRHTSSVVIKADSLHYRADLLVNVLVVLSFVLTMVWRWQLFDPIIALLISAYIFKSAWHVGREAFDNLMDKEFSDEERKKIIEAAFTHPKVKGIHDLRTRRSGTKPFIQLHLELDGKLSLEKAHVISESIVAAINKRFPHAEVLIHQDPQKPEPLAAELGQVVPTRKRTKKAMSS